MGPVRARGALLVALCATVWSAGACYGHLLCAFAIAVVTAWVEGAPVALERCREVRPRMMGVRACACATLCRCWQPSLIPFAEHGLCRTRACARRARQRRDMPSGDCGRIAQDCQLVQARMWRHRLGDGDRLLLRPKLPLHRNMGVGVHRLRYCNADEVLLEASPRC